MSLYIFPDTTLLGTANTWTQNQSFITSGGVATQLTIGNNGATGTTCTITGTNFSTIPWLAVNTGTNNLSFMTITTGGAVPQQFTFTSDGALGLQDASQSGSISVQLAANSSVALTANRKLTFDVVDAARTVKLTGNLTIANNFTTAGNFALTLTATGATNVTLPTSGTLLTTAGSGSSLTFGTGTLALAGNLTTSGAFATTITTTGTTTITLPTTGTLASLANISQTFAGLTTFTKGVNHGNENFPTYKINLDFGSDVAGTWRRLVVASLVNAQYSTVGFRIRVVDPNANHAVLTSVSADIETYMVACVRTESTILDTPDVCVVRGPSNRIQAVKTAVGQYEIQIQNEAQFREYQVEIDCYANNGAHTITYENGSTVGSVGVAQYTASVGTSTFFTENLGVKGILTVDGGINLLESAGATFYTKIVSGTDLTANTTLTLAGLGTADRTLTFPGGNASVTLASISNISQTFAGISTFSNATVTIGSSTAASTYGLGTGATLAATTKTINIGTAGVSTSITNVNIGSATSDTTTDIYGVVEVLAAETGGVASNGLIKIHGKDFGTVPATITQGAFGVNPWLVINSGTSANSFTSIQTANNAYTWTFTSSGNLNLPGALQLDDISDPAAPSAGMGYLYAKTIAGKVVPKWMGPSGLDYPLQASFWQNNIVMWNPTTATAGVWLGTAGAGSSTYSTALPTDTNKYTSIKRGRWANVVTTTNQVLGQRNTEAMFFRGSAVSGAGGFFFYTRCGFDIWTNGGRFFAGMHSATTVITAEPSALNNTVGFCIDSTDNGAIFFLTRGTAATKASTGFTVTSNNGYDLYIFCSPGSSQYTWRIVDIVAGTEASGTATATLPTNTTKLTAGVLASNAALTPVNSIQLGVNRIYVETDY